MSERLPAEVRTLLGEAARRAPGRRVALIVTVKPGAIRRPLPGLHVTRRFDAIPSIAGDATPADALALADCDDVVRIEIDSEMHALGDPDAPSR
jgi:hypothetical protein